MNLRTTMEKIVQRAGVPSWPKLFHNLRASRETELCQRFPIHVVCEWIGNSAAVAVRHYLQVTENDFDRAGSAAGQPDEHVERNHERPMQSQSDLERPGASEKSRKRPKNSINPQKPAKTEWAMRDSNPRHPPCKGGALAD